VDVLETIVQHIKDTAANNKFHNFIHQPSDLYKLETSFIHRPEEYTVTLILHVPYVETKNLLPLYEFISLVIHFNFSSNVLVIPDIGKQVLITIGNTEAIQTLSSSDLAICKCLGKTFLCEGRSVLQTNIIEDCMGSLYLGSATLIKHNCKFRIDSTWATTPGLSTPLVPSLQTKFVPRPVRCHPSPSNQANMSRSRPDATFQP
jgi:hypothetical protein